MQDLELWFNKARLIVQVENKPLNINNLKFSKDIFQMSIEIKGRGRIKEYFKIFKGHQNNRVEVIDANSNLRQIILLVKEPEREYKVSNWNYKKNKYIEEIVKTQDFLRKYLCGFDEKHLFITQLPKDQGLVNKVKDAHRILKPNIVTVNQNKTNRIKRQGEWFFIPINSDQQDLISENQRNIIKKVRIGRGRNHHIADQFLEIDGYNFVKGKICHVEHKTLKLHGWFEVIRNLESSISTGIKWID